MKLFEYARMRFRGPRKSARAIIIRDGLLLAFRRKRLDRLTGEWLDYYSIPGGGIDPGETPEQAAVRELGEEMGVEVTLGPLVAHRVGRWFEHYVFTAAIASGEPHLMEDSEEAAHMSEYNQYLVEWVPVTDLSVEKLRYYSDYLPLIKDLAVGKIPTVPHELRDT